jgi:uncharacterized protein (DUF58 family)
VEKFIPPKKGASHVLRLVRDLLNFEPQGRGTNLGAALEYVGRVTRRRSIVFLISDFLAHGYLKPLRLVAGRHDLVAIALGDPREQEFPDVGLVELEDPETGERVLVDSSSAAVRSRFQALARVRDKERQELFRSTGVDEIRVLAGEDYVRDLMAFFRKRGRRL